MEEGSARKSAAGSAGWPAVERRRAGDRRHQPTRFWDAFFHPRRRQRGRRRSEQRGVYVDVYAWGDVLLVIAILVLNVLDAVFTLRHLERGGREANPLMAFLIEAGERTFLFQKSVVVGVWLLLLLVHKEFRLARAGLWALLDVYSALLLYHVALAVRP